MPSSRGSATYEDRYGKGHRGHSVEFNLHSHFIEEATKLETVSLETEKRRLSTASHHYMILMVVFHGTGGLP